MKAKQITTLVFLAGGSALLGFFGYETINLILKDINLFSASKNNEETSSGPTWIPRKLLKQEIANKDEYRGDKKIAQKYGNYLLAVYGDDNDFNKQIWEEKYNDISSSQSAEFSSTNITSAFSKKSLNSDESRKSLNKVCDNVYKKELEDIERPQAAFGSKHRLRNDFWKFCSVFGETPKVVYEVIEDNNEYSGKIGGNNKKILLSVQEGVNNEVWNIKQRKFKLEKNTTSPYFKALKNNNELEQENALRNKCKEAYKFDKNTVTRLASETATTPSVRSILKYCSI